MTITRNDLKIFKPELLGSSDDAGGQRTKNEVQSGQLNELFRAISDIDHAQSAVDIVKCYPALDTADTSILLDGHVFISQKPADPLVSMLIAESAALGDADRMTDMVEILESSVKAGQLIRNRLIGLLEGQDSFPRSYLQSTYMFNGKEYYENVTLQQGQVIVISVEYQGNENANWPRFEHFCEVQKTVTGGQGGQVSFKPPIPYDTPNYDVMINGENGCTKLRYVSDNDGIKYHGVSALTAENTANTLDVSATETELLPRVRSVAVSTGNSINASGGNDTPTSVIMKNLQTPGVSGQYTYSFEVPDLLNNDYVNQILKLKPIASGTSMSWSVSVTGNTVTATGTPRNWGGSNTGGYVFDPNVTLSYVSADKYSMYDSNNAFPAGNKIAIGTTSMTITFLDTGYGNLVLSEQNGVFYAEGRIFAELDYNTGVVTHYPDAKGEFSVDYVCLIEPGLAEDNAVNFNLLVADPIPETFYLIVSSSDGQTLLSASGDENGVITGANISGTIAGKFVSITFGVDVDLTSLRYDISETVTLSPPPELYGLNPLRIKNGGLVESFTAWNTISIQHTQTQAVVSPQPAQTYNVRANARFVDITDATGASLWTLNNAHFSVEKATGVVTINSEFSGFTAPFLLTDSIGETALVTDVQLNKLVLAAPLSQTFPIGSVVSSIQNLGDMQARVSAVRDMTSWNNNWDLDGAPATASMNVVDYPIEVVNNTAINEDWVLIFTSSTAYRCVGRRIGQVATGDTVNDFAPINPLTQAPYFIIRNQAFGGGWNVGEAVRFKTYASANPIMMLRTVQSGHSQITTDRAVLSFRGNES